MTPDDMRAWRRLMGLDRKGAIHLLGVSNMAISNWETGKHRISTRTALACAALAAGLTPFQATKESNSNARDQEVSGDGRQRARQPGGGAAA